jgi:hypothetical protein
MYGVAKGLRDKKAKYFCLFFRSKFFGILGRFGEDVCFVAPVAPDV